MQWLSWWRSMSWIFYREIVKIGRDPSRWQCSTSHAIFLCSWDLEIDDDSLVGQLTSGNVAWGKSDKQPKQRERDGRRIWKLARGLGQKTRSETALRKRQHEWQIDNTNDKALLNKQTIQSIHCFDPMIRYLIHLKFTCSIGPHSHFHPFVY